MADFDADAFADSLPGWDPEARAAFLASLDDDEAPELPLLAESVDEMDPAMVEALMQLRDGGEPPSELAVDAKERGDAPEWKSNFGHPKPLTRRRRPHICSIAYT